MYARARLVPAIALQRRKKKKASVCREKTEVGLRQWMMPHKAHWDTKVFEADIGFHSL